MEHAYNNRKQGEELYIIELNGCDDSTRIAMILNEDELELYKVLTDKSHEVSAYGCMPTITIYEITNIESLMSKWFAFCNEDEEEDEIATFEEWVSRKSWEWKDPHISKIISPYHYTDEYIEKEKRRKALEF